MLDFKPVDGLAAAAQLGNDSPVLRNSIRKWSSTLLVGMFQPSGTAREAIHYLRMIATAVTARTNLPYPDHSVYLVSRRSSGWPTPTAGYCCWGLRQDWPRIGVVIIPGGFNPGVRIPPAHEGGGIFEPQAINPKLPHDLQLELARVGFSKAQAFLRACDEHPIVAG